MLLTKNSINDFGVYRGHNEFDFKTTPDKPIILCGGTNGAGKTTLFESVMLCLYGQGSSEQRISQKQYHEKILRTIHRYLGTKKSADEASIAIEFQFAHDGKIEEYQVMRMWQNNEGKIEEKLSIKKKNLTDERFSDLGDMEESEWQLFIDQLIPRGIAKLFFFDGEKIQSIADEGGEDRHIKSSFDALLGLDLVKQLRDDIGLTLLRNSEGETKKIEEEISLLTSQKDESEKQLTRILDKKVTLNMQIQSLQKKLQAQEEIFNKLGGQFANKREQLSMDKIKMESKLEHIEAEIRELCGTILPFALVPKQLLEVKNEIKSDQQKIQNSFEKEILEKNCEEILSEIQSKEFLSTYDDGTKQDFIKQMGELLQNKIEKIPAIHQTTYNLSPGDMRQMIQLIETINDSSVKKIEDLTMSYSVITNSLERIKVGLDSAPKDDEIGPVFSEISKINRELGELQNELKYNEDLESQEKSHIAFASGKIRTNLDKKILDKKRLAGLEIGYKVQEVLDDYSKFLRNKKLELLENYILDGLKMLLHKKDFIEKIVIDPETFEVRLYKGNDDEITKEMLSKGELQMYATAVVWGLAKTSGRPLPFMIDTPLARLDMEHRSNLVEKFYPQSHQTIILTTNSEITYEYFKQLEPFVAKSYVIQYDSDKGKTIKHENCFFDKTGENIIEV